MNKVLDCIKFAAIASLFIIGLADIAKASNCTIDLLKSSPTSKTSYTADKGESISQSILDKLSSQCKFNTRLMTLEEKRQFDISKLKKRLVKLQGVK